MSIKSALVQFECSVNNGISIRGVEVLEEIEEVGEVLERVGVQVKKEEVEEREVEQEVGKEEEAADLGVGHQMGLDLSCSTQSSHAPSAH